MAYTVVQTMPNSDLHRLVLAISTLICVGATCLFTKKYIWKWGFQLANHWPCRVQELLPCISSNLVGPSADMPLLVPVKALEDHPNVNQKKGGQRLKSKGWDRNKSQQIINEFQGLSKLGVEELCLLSCKKNSCATIFFYQPSAHCGTGAREVSTDVCEQVRRSFEFLGVEFCYGLRCFLGASQIVHVWQPA